MKRILLLGAMCVAIAGIATVSVALAVIAYCQRLPEPEQADHEGLFRWLVLTRLSDEPQDIQLRLLNRVEKELAGGTNLTECLTKIDSQQCARLSENVDRLAECWFVREADRYYAAPKDGRIALLKHQAERVRQLGIFEQISTLEAHGRGGSPAQQAPATAADDYVRRLNRWLSDVGPHERQRLSDYFWALRGALVWNSLEQGLGIRE